MGLLWEITKHVRHFDSLWCTGSVIVLSSASRGNVSLERWVEMLSTAHRAGGGGGFSPRTLPSQGSHPPLALSKQTHIFRSYMRTSLFYCILKGSWDPGLREPLPVHVAVTAVTLLSPFVRDERWPCVGSWGQSWIVWQRTPRTDSTSSSGWFSAAPEAQIREPEAFHSKSGPQTLNPNRWKQMVPRKLIHHTSDTPDSTE